MHFLLLAQETVETTSVSSGAYVGISLVSMLIGGIIGALIGMSKNRAFLGFVLGALLGCIGWIIMLFLDKKQT